jgi:PAS domain S-box-containing protein
MTDYSADKYTSGGKMLKLRAMFEAAPVGILIFSNEFKVRFVNQTFFGFRGIAPLESTDITGENIEKIGLFENKEIFSLLKENQPFEKELYSSVTASGDRMAVLIKYVPVNTERQFEGGIVVLEDIKYRFSGEGNEVLNYKKIFESICDCYLICDREGNINYSSKECWRYNFLFDSATLKEEKPGRLSGILFKKLFEQLKKSNDTLWTEIPYVKDDKQQIAVIALIPLNGNVLLLVRNKEIDKKEKELLQEEIKELRKYEYIISNMIDAVFLADDLNRIVYWSESAARLFGLKRSEVHGKEVSGLFSKIDRNYLHSISQKLIENKYVEDFIKLGEDEESAEYFTLRIGKLKEGVKEYFVFICADSTFRIRKELELKKSEERFRKIVTHTQEFICILDLNGKIQYANPAMLQSFGYTDQEINSLYFVDLIEPYYLMTNGFSLSDLEERKTETIELPLITKHDQKIYVHASFSTVYDDRGMPLYYNVFLTDISMLKEAEKDLMLIRSIFEASHDGIALINRRKLFLVNEAFVKMFGYKSASEIIGKDPLDFVDVDDIIKVGRNIQSLEEGRESPSRFEFKGIKADEIPIELESSVSSYEAEGEKFIVWSLRDITPQKKAIEALRLSEERYRSITENIDESFWTAERIRGKLVQVFYTPAIEKITGYKPEKFLEDRFLWKKIIHPDDLANVIENLKRLYKFSDKNYEKLEYRIIDSLGNIIWIENKISVRRDDSGRIIKIFGIVNDITMSKRAQDELKRSAAELKELNETKDRFISIISHDLRTPFSSILGFTDFLLNEKDLTEEKRTQYIRFIEESARNMLELVNSLLDWTRLQTGRIKFEPNRINAKQVVDKSIQILSGAALRKGIDLKSELSDNLFIHADENLLLQAINNLISNAIKFTPTGGAITISAAPDVKNKSVVFSVKDTGTGIKEEDIPKLFKVDTKFTTPGTAGEKGSGLGLSLVREIILKHGGDIHVKSQYGKGSEFIFTVPVSSTTILLVDDIKTDRILYSKLIRNLIEGYTIREAENGKEALEIVKSASPALIISDHNMPVMNGYDFVKQLTLSDLKFKPPVIILSSDINPSVEEQYKQLGVEFVFRKPVNLATFKNAIEKSLRKSFFG